MWFGAASAAVDICKRRKDSVRKGARKQAAADAYKQRVERVQEQSRVRQDKHDAVQLRLELKQGLCGATVRWSLPVEGCGPGTTRFGVGTRQVGWRLRAQSRGVTVTHLHIDPRDAPPHCCFVQTPTRSCA